ncbi:aromatic and neutral aliphatic amino acid permease [Gaeumannomyces tritici R3-111a-1]|uniref:Aromatic and neutral aliphatic amino acid permease n=1 Tax=Gaeumannomyces tritici (strain R3-111a-1) TaxID=644352 RepID=J3P4K6_GAET3|nr:aromatic and neutral aliphatic amino acid permease [Gaeumannomyces tritici R3-111a-1]EJT74603.1 aromatic and neutral aliphatic amino acid permease [Gaeumannomyces tritici R3-111a-1]
MGTESEAAATRPEAPAPAGSKEEQQQQQPPPPPPEQASVWTREEGELIDYHTLSWWQGGIVLIAETVSLGILSLPSVLATVGLAPGIVLILIMSGLSTYSGMVLAEFRAAYPYVQNFGDALEVIGKSIGMGPLFQEVFGWAQVTFQVFVMASHLLTWTICLNTLTDSSTCTIVWAVVGLGVFAVLNFPRTLKHTAWMSMASCISIVVAVLVTIGDVAYERPIGSKAIEAAREIPFTSGMLAITNIAVSFSSHSCFFSVIGEFKKPEDFPKALALLQIADTTLYLLAAIVIYVCVGPNVPSPALSAAASRTMRKAIWGIAIPTIVIAGVIYGHVAAKYIFARIFRDSKHAVRRTKLSGIVWLAIVCGLWALSMVIAESIPVFNSLLGIVAAIFASWFSYGLPGVFWLWMHWGDFFSSKRQTARFAGNVLLFITGLLICVLGLWASIEAIATERVTKPWSCASNAAP